MTDFIDNTILTPFERLVHSLTNIILSFHIDNTDTFTHFSDEPIGLVRRFSVPFTDGGETKFEVVLWLNWDKKNKKQASDDSAAGGGRRMQRRNAVAPDQRETARIYRLASIFDTAVEGVCGGTSSTEEEDENDDDKDDNTSASIPTTALPILLGLLPNLPYITVGQLQPSTFYADDIIVKSALACAVSATNCGVVAVVVGVIGVVNCYCEGIGRRFFVNTEQYGKLMGVGGTVSNIKVDVRKKSKITLDSHYLSSRQGRALSLFNSASCPSSASWVKIRVFRILGLNADEFPGGSEAALKDMLRVLRLKIDVGGKFRDLKVFEFSGNDFVLDDRRRLFFDVRLCEDEVWGIVTLAERVT